MKKQAKIFVLDTNVILHDFKSIYNFEENDVVIPITVLEELDKFKKGNDLINYHAREFMRELDKITGNSIPTQGISLGNDRGILFIETGKDFSEEMEKSFSEKTPDHRILAVANYIHHRSQDRLVVLVTQDINLRMKAKSLGIRSEDYETGKVKTIDHWHKEVSSLEHLPEDLINEIYKSKDGIAIDTYAFKIDFQPHQYMILKGEKGTSVLVHYDAISKRLQRVDKHKSYGITPKNAEQSFAMDALMRPEIKLISITGKAGTGKTLLALAAALEQRNEFQQILLARPIVALANRDMGFLPGDEKQKITPYMQPLYDNLSVIKHQFTQGNADYKRIEEMEKTDRLVISPLAYIRGRSLANVYFIVDEAQNLTPHEIKTIITRAGEGTKMIFTGDVQQIDCPYLDAKSNGLSYLTDKMKGQNVFAHVHLVHGERSQLAEIASNLL